ncbi:MAG: 50S ribosomal protein L15 [Deinococcales bacterium]
MKLNQLKPAAGAKHSRRRIGRGLGSGRGKTAGRGQKGQLSRSGYSKGIAWEGGRSRLFARLPKRGFNNNQFRESYQIVNLGDLNKLPEGSNVTAASLREHGIVRHGNRPVKLLGQGELEVSGLIVELDNYSKSAVQAIEAKGGTVKNKKPEADGPSEE